MWGEDSCILESYVLHSIFVARAMTFVECYTINRTDIVALLPDFPDFADDLRRRTVRLAARRAFVLEARHRMEAAAEEEAANQASIAVEIKAAAVPVVSTSRRGSLVSDLLRKVSGGKRAPSVSAPAPAEGPDFGGHLLGGVVHASGKGWLPIPVLNDPETAASPADQPGGRASTTDAASSDVAALAEAVSKLSAQMASGFAALTTRQDALSAELRAALLRPDADGGGAQEPRTSFAL